MGNTGIIWRATRQAPTGGSLGRSARRRCNDGLEIRTKVWSNEAWVDRRQDVGQCSAPFQKFESSSIRVERTRYGWQEYDLGEAWVSQLTEKRK